MKFTFHDFEFIVHGKSLIWPQRDAVIITDVHLGKSSFFQMHGMPLPDLLQHELQRLTLLMGQTGCRTLIVLGDLFHHERAMNHSFHEAISWWRHEYPFEIVLIEGNHDRRVTLPDSWGILREPWLDNHGLSLRHDWDMHTSLPQLAGHLHPALRLSDGADSLRVPCFWIRPAGIVLPAFTDVGGHYDVPLATDESAILITPEGPLAFP